nr:hypothetical protein GCM10020185_46030 [Pseudomonas brassicacearum subsp. brassicacearum]
MVGCEGGVYIRFCGNGYLGFRPDGGSLSKKRESNQSAFAPPLGTSPRLGVPSLRHCSVGRREGPSMAQRGYPGIHAGMPTPQRLRSASVVNGAPEINVHREAA